MFSRSCPFCHFNHQRGQRPRAGHRQGRHGDADDRPARGPAAGQQVIGGARLYIKQHGDRVAGKQIELIVRDDASSGETGKRLIQELVVNDKVDVIGGGLTADLLPSAPLLTEAQKPAVIMISSTTAVVEKSPFFVRTSCTLAQSSAIMADWAVKKRLSKAVTLVTEFAPGLEAEETFTNNYKAAGGQLVEAI